METSSKIALWFASFAAALLVGFTALLLPDVLLSRSAMAAEETPFRLAEGEQPKPPCGTPEGIPCDQLTEMEVRDVVPLAAADSHAVVLVAKGSGTVLPIFVDEGSAVAIAFRLAHRESPHPLAQDLLDRVVEKLGGTVTEVRIDDVQQDVFHGRVFISQGERKLELDARPSDSIAMALTRGAKIFATEKVLAQAGISRAEIDQLRKNGPHGAPGPAPEQGPGFGGSGEEGLGEELPPLPHGRGKEIEL